MSLKITNWKVVITRTLWVILGILLLVFIIRTSVWEHEYYTSKEGSERVVVEKAETVEVDESDVTEQQVQEYTVAPDRPRYITMEKLNIHSARVIAVGLKANSELGTPNNIFDVGWYDASGKPGYGGTLLLDGHNGGPTRVGIFKYLPMLSARDEASGKAGDIISIERGDGAIFNYEVIENITVPLDEADAYMATAMKSPIAGMESLSMITCTGEWSDARSTYLSRQFVRAVLVAQ